jgi:hypothetical protein
MRNLDTESYDLSTFLAMQEAQRQAAAAADYANRSGTTGSGFGYGSGVHTAIGMGNNEARKHAYQQNHLQQQATDRHNFDQGMRQTMHERNLLNAEAERRQYDSDTGRHSAVEGAKTAQYSAETGRLDSGYQHQGRMGMNEALKGLTAGIGGGNQAPGIDLYGAGGQQIGGSRGPAVSPLKSLLNR